MGTKTTACIKYTLAVLNSLYMGCGIALLAAGMALLFEPTINMMFDLAMEAAGDNLAQYSAYLLIAVGVCAVIVGVLGCTGACLQSKPMLAVYIMVTLVVMAGELSAGCLILVFKDVSVNKISSRVDNKMKTEPYDRFAPSEFWSHMIKVQAQGECCGLNGPGDYSKLQFQKTYGIQFPYTCCKKAQPDDDPQRGMMGGDGGRYVSCQQSSDINTYYSVGCLGALRKVLDEQTTLMLGASIGFAGINIFGLIFAILLCRTRKEIN